MTNIFTQNDTFKTLVWNSCHYFGYLLSLYQHLFFSQLEISHVKWVNSKKTNTDRGPKRSCLPWFYEKASNELNPYSTSANPLLMFCYNCHAYRLVVRGNIVQPLSNIRVRPPTVAKYRRCGAACAPPGARVTGGRAGVKHLMTTYVLKVIHTRCCGCCL